jgi:Tol biopolymer transport system component
VSAPSLSDTAMARSLVPFVVDVRDSHGGYSLPATLIVNASAVDAPPGRTPPTVYASASPDGGGGSRAFIPLDRDSRATFWIQRGTTAGKVTLSLTAFDVSERIDLEIVPANPAKIQIQPADTVIYVGKSYGLDATVVDQWGNDRPEPISFTAGPGLTVSSSGNVTAGEIGRRAVQLRSGAITAEAWVTVPPEGELAAISGPTYFESIVVLGLDGSDWRSLAQLQTYSQRTAPQWSPDGQRLVFHNWTDTAIAAYRVDLDGKVEHALGADAPAAQIFPRYSRDGQWLFFSGGPDVRTVAIWRARADGSEPVQVGPPVAELDYDSDPSPSPDGSRVVYLAGGFISPRIRILEVSTGVETPLDIPAMSARWSPVADRIAYVDNSGRVVLIDPDGGNQRILSAPGRSYARGLDWSPDGEWLVVRSAEKPVVVLIRVETGETLPLPFSMRIEEPAWRPGGAAGAYRVVRRSQRASASLMRAASGASESPSALVR